MRRTKKVYSYNQNSIYIGEDVAYESWNSVDSENPVFLIPSDSTDVEVPEFNPLLERAIYNKELNYWDIKVIPTPENTIKPLYNKDIQYVIWSDEKWNIVELPTPENTPKPIYDENLYSCEWDYNLKDWNLKSIPTWESVRIERDLLLKESDWTVMPDSNPKPSKQAWLDYRQTLRDIPQNFLNPEDVVFPTKP